MFGKENQQTISQWADQTFGKAHSVMRVATRANEEMAELLRALAAGDDAKAADEVADVFIVLCRVAELLGFEIDSAVERKMFVNRKRVWKRDGTGHGYHVRDKTEAA